MSLTNSTLGVVAIILIAIVLAVLLQLSPRARIKRLQRRLKKTHSRIVSRSDRPSVKFSVKTPKDRK